MSARLRLCVALFFAAAMFGFMQPAFAQASGQAGDFHCSGGSASGTLYDESASQCPTTLSVDHVFSFLVCNMEKLSSNILGQMYCGVIDNLKPAIDGVLTLSILFFGIGFTTGFIHATAREFQVYLIKIALVWTFATQSDYMIGVGYHFLVTGAREGIAIALSGIDQQNGTAASGAQIYGYLDKFLAKALEYASAMVGMKWDDSNGLATCQNAVFNVIAIMAVAFPPLFYVSVAIIFNIAFTFIRAVFGYMYAIMGITFLMTLSPFFLSFALFRQTKPFFDKYVAYLASFTLQMVIVFAFLAFVVSIPVGNITSSITGIIVPNKENKETTSFRFPWQYCTVCDFEMVDAQGNKMDDKTANNAAIIHGGKLQCKSPQTPMALTDATAPNSGKAPNKELQNELIRFASTGLLSIFVLAYVVDTILRYIPSIAQSLAGGMGATWAPQLGGGFSPRGIPTTQMPGYNLMQTFDNGFSDGYADAWKAGPTTSIQASLRGVQEGMRRLATGGGTRTGSERLISGAASQNDPGLVDSFAAFFVNPNPDTPDQ